MIPVRLVFAHVRTQPLRWLLTSGSVALALFLFCTLQTVLSSLQMITEGASGNRLITSSAVSLFQSLPISGIQRIEAARIPGVRHVGHWTWFDGVYRDPKEFFPRFAIDVKTFRKQYRRPVSGRRRVQPHTGRVGALRAREGFVHHRQGPGGPVRPARR